MQTRLGLIWGVLKLADDNDLDYLRDFLAKVHTSATVHHQGETLTMDDFNGIDHTKYGAATRRIFIYPGEIIGVSYDTFIKVYKVHLRETSLPNIDAALTAILTGCRKIQFNIAITAYTRPAGFLSVEFVSANKPFIHQTVERVDQVIFLKCEVM